MLIVAALGGNALVRRGEAADLATQRRNLAAAADALAPLARDHALILTHGNGPQIGLLALQSEQGAGSRALPLDVLGAESEGLIGYLIEQDIANRLPGREVATLLTRVVVDAADPAFAAPTKPIGPVYGEADARRLAAERGWRVAADGAHFRRVVASPEPRRIIELRTIRLLVDHGVVVVCAGGGGIPVATDEAGAARGVEAVIDKDLAAALLARDVGADVLLLLTDVPAVYDDWPEPAMRPLRDATPRGLRARRFAEGSMAPKIEAACRFVESGGRFAAIGALADAARLLRREAGTIVAADPTR
ncbi:MAG: carbamate kinase [Alphaproteobacteria bacterium]|nr:carbamate kinase [Alphaproteobacteria bacterium]